MGQRAFVKDTEASARSVDKLGKAGDRAGRGAKGLDKFTRNAAKMQSVGSKMTRTVTGPLVLGMGFAVKASLDFQKQISALGAVTGASTKELAGLREAALTAGRGTAFGAKDVALAQTELAKGGLSVQQVMGGGLKSALALAAAGELELGDAATYTANAMNLFALNGRDSMKVADAMAVAANATTADVADFGMALNQGGSVAKTVGLSFTETMLALEALAKSGIKGSDAGTSLKTALIQLVKPSAKQAALADDLGLKFTDGAGRMKSMADISTMLRGRLGGMTKAQRTATLATIAGTDGVRTLTSLYDAGPKKLRRWAQGLEQTGTAAEQAAERQTPLGVLLASLNTLAIRVGDVFAPSLNKAVVKITDLVDGFSGLPKGARTAVVAFGLFAAAAGPALFVVGGLIRNMRTIRSVLGGMKGVFAKVFGRAGAVGGAAASTGVATTTAAQTPKKLARKAPVFARAGGAAGATMGGAAGTTAATTTAAGASTGVLASAKGGKLRRGFGVAGGLAGKAFGLGIAATIPSIVNDFTGGFISKSGVTIRSWIRDEFGVTLGSTESSRDFVKRTGGTPIPGAFDRKGNYQGISVPKNRNPIGRASGGLVPRGEDGLIGARRGEFMMRERAVRRYGLPAMRAVNEGRVQPLNLAGAGGGPVEVTVHNHTHLDGREIERSTSKHRADRQARR